MRKLILSSFIAVFMLCSTSFAMTLDADKVTKQIKEGKQQPPVVGVWNVAQHWDPSPDQAKGYWVGIVKNTFGIKNADYVGVLLCKKEGVKTGDVRLLLKKTKDKNKFQATFHTIKGDATGMFVLVDKNTADMGSVILKEDKDYPLIRSIVRVQNP